MGEFETKQKIVNKYKNKIKAYSYPVWVGEDIPQAKLDVALKTFATNVKKEDVLAFYDTTMFRSGKSGSVFTITKWIYRWVSDKPVIIYYDEIDTMSVIPGEKPNDEYADNNILIIKLIDGKEIRIKEYCYKKDQIVEMLLEIKNYKKSKKSSTKGNGIIDGSSAPEINYEQSKDFASVSAGITSGHVDQVRKSFNEEKIRAAQGHGFAAEQANDFIDSLTGHKISASLGDDFAKHGADRLVDGIYIQSKYCVSGSKCVEACFENGEYLYFQNGIPMQVEVPKDMYPDALHAMERRIEAGQVPGVSDPKEAEKLVRKGHITYKQAVNLAKAGTVESLVYDAAKGVVSASSAFGITTLCSFSQAIWRGDDFDVAIQDAVSSGLKVGGTVILNSIISGQLLRAGLNSAMVGGTEAIASALGSDTSAFLANAFRESGKEIYGIAAQKNFAKMLRGNIVSAGVTIVILSSFDVNNLFKGKISGKQLLKNLVNTSSTVVGGIGGYIAGQAMIPIPVVGGLVGSAIVGGASGKASNAIMKNIVEDDAVELVEIVKEVFTSLADEYLFNSREGEKAVDKLQSILTASKLKDMFASEDKYLFAREMLEPIFEEIASKRKHISVPSNDDMRNAFIKMLDGEGDEDGDEEESEKEEAVCTRSDKEIEDVAKRLFANAKKPKDTLVSGMQVKTKSEVALRGVDWSLFSNGKSGYLITTKGIYTSMMAEKQIHFTPFKDLFMKHISWKSDEHKIIEVDSELLLFGADREAAFLFERINMLIKYLNGDEINTLNESDFFMKFDNSFNFYEKYHEIGAYYTFINGDNVTTKRGIKFPSSLKDIIKAYGETEVFDIDYKKDKIYVWGSSADNSDVVVLEKAKKCIRYYMSGYEMNFYFNDKNELILIGFYTNGF